MKPCQRCSGISYVLASVCGLGLVIQTSGSQPDGFQLEPIITQYAETVSRITLDLNFSVFEDAQLQEADDLSGYGASFELVVPFLERFQIRLAYPAYTQANGTYRKAGNPLDGSPIEVEGNTGFFDFPTAILDYQFLGVKRDEGWNAAGFAGVGYSIGNLETSVGDIFNHKGYYAVMGLKADSELNERWRLAGNFAARYYWASDDIHPEGGDVFWLWDLSAAVIYKPEFKQIYPVLELLYQGDFDLYNTVQLAPELIVPFCRHFELKVAFPVGLTSDGERWSTQIQGTVLF